MCMFTRGRNLNLTRNSQTDEEYFRNFDGKLMNIYMINGFRMQGYIYEVDKESIVVTKPGKTVNEDKKCLLYKNAISTIEPAE